MASKSFGQINYEGYSKCSGGRSLISGDVLPEWKDLKRDVQEAWEAGAQAVFHYQYEQGMPIRTEPDRGPSL